MIILNVIKNRASLSPLKNALLEKPQDRKEGRGWGVGGGSRRGGGQIDLPPQPF